MRRAHARTTALLAAGALLSGWAGTACAQQAPANDAGLRYLSWPGKATPPQPRPRATPVSAPASARAALDASPAVPLARQTPAAPGRIAPRQGLTPADAFYAPIPPSAPGAFTAQPYAEAPAPREAAPAPAPEPAPVPSAPAQPLLQPGAGVAALEATPPQPAPVQPSPVQASPLPSPPADPMAPRRDAPIFRLQRQGAMVPEPTAAAAAPQQMAQAQTPPAAAAPYGQPVRFYSVHRQAGHRPDAVVAPEQTYLDGLPVELIQPPASADMAEPDGPPALLRDVNGRVRAMPQSQADDLP